MFNWGVICDTSCCNPKKKYMSEIAQQIDSNCFLTSIGRLDGDTTGLLLLATTIMGPLRELICSHKIEKTYICGKKSLRTRML